MLLKYLLLILLQTNSSFPAVVQMYQFLHPIIMQFVRKLIYHIHVLCISSNATSCRKYEVPYTTKGESFPFHGMINHSFLDLIYTSVLCVFVNNATHLLRNNAWRTSHLYLVVICAWSSFVKWVIRPTQSL